MRAAFALVMGMAASVCFPLGLSDDSKEISFKNLEVGFRPAANADDGGVKILRTREEFEKYLKRWSDDKIKRPAVDFAKEQIVAIQVAGEINQPLGMRLKRLVRKSPGQVDAEVVMDKSLRTGLNFARKPVLNYVIVRTPKFDDLVTVRVMDE